MALVLSLNLSSTAVFLDMGVSRGHKLGSKGGPAPRKWYSKIKTREVAILRFLLLRNYSVFALRALETNLKLLAKTEK